MLEQEATSPYFFQTTTLPVGCVLEKPPAAAARSYTSKVRFVTFTEYRVTGKRQYRGHDPGSLFEANLDPGPEQRAIARGDIKVIRRVTPAIQPGSVRSPDGWLPVTTNGQEGRR